MVPIILRVVSGRLLEAALAIDCGTVDLVSPAVDRRLPIYSLCLLQVVGADAMIGRF